MNFTRRSLLAAGALVIGCGEAADATGIKPIATSGARGWSGRSQLLAPSQNLTLSGSRMNGEVDGDYHFRGTLYLPAAPVHNALTFLPNNDSGNATGHFINPYNTVSSPGVAAPATALIVASPDTTTFPTTVVFDAVIASKTGQGPRHFSLEAFWEDHLGKNSLYFQGLWLDAASPLTSVVVHSDQAGGLLTGSLLRGEALGFTA